MAPTPCQECHEQPFQYQCPRCSLRTCSLKCCQAHKKRTGCSGKRDRTSFVPLARMTDATMQNDYHFLEDVIGQVDSGKRLLRQTGSGAPKRVKKNEEEDDVQHPLLQSTDSTRFLTSQFQDVHLAPRFRSLRQEAAERQITLLVMPPGMDRHKQNQSHLKKADQSIYWSVEWKMLGASKEEKEDIKTDLVKESIVLREVCPAKDGTTVLLRQIPGTAFAKVSLDVTLREALRDRTVIEYPTFLVVPNERLQEFSLTLEEL